MVDWEYKERLHIIFCLFFFLALKSLMTFLLFTTYNLYFICASIAAEEQVHKRYYRRNCQQKFAINNPMPTGVPSLGFEETLFKWTVCKPERHSHGRNWKCTSLRQRSPYIEKVPTLGPDWSISMQPRHPNLYILIGPNNYCPDW